MASSASKRNASLKSDAPRPKSRPSTDPRFANLTTDPRYSLPSRRHTHVKIDKRFAHMLHDDDFSAKSTIDKYGRRIPKGSGKKKLGDMYQVESSEDESGGDADGDDEVRKELARVERKYDPARQGGFSESSSSESEQEGSSSSSEDEEERDAAVEAGLEQDGPNQEGTEDVPTGEVSSRIAAVNLDWDNIRAVDLMAVANSFCPPDGRITDVSIYISDFGKERMEREELEGPSKEFFVSKKHRTRIEQDDSVKTTHSANPRHRHVPSDEDEEDDDQIQKSILAHAADPEPEIDSRALRVYQLSRLRYFYAIITCSSSSAAHTLYTAMDGREYLSTANFFDLRFVPDDITFNEKAKDVCKQLSEGYRPNEFVTEALTHSKVRLTWDEEDQGRKQIQKRAFGTRDKGRAKDRAAEMDENDLRAYVGSGSDSSEEDDQTGGGVALDGLQAPPKEAKASKSDQTRSKMREALGLSVDDDNDALADRPKTKGSKGKATSRPAVPAGNLQITFSAALNSTPLNGTSSVFQNKPPVADETTREKYIRQEKERKARRKAKSQDKANNVEAGKNEAKIGVDDHINNSRPAHANEEAAGQKNPFDDPFFEDPASVNAEARKTARREKREAIAEEATAVAEKRKQERAQLELLMDDTETTAGGLTGAGFDMVVVRKGEKEAARRGRKSWTGRKGRKDHESAVDRADGDNFELDVEDPRFRGVFENHEFAIDPSNPRFSGTKGMKKLLEEGRKKRRVKARDGDGEPSAKGKGDEEDRTFGADRKEVDELVRKIKRRKAG